MESRLAEEEIAAWVSKHLALAPERDEAWGEEVMRAYLGPEDRAAA